MTKKIIAEINNNSIQTFSHNEFGKLQVIEQNGEFHFVARDIAKILGYAKKSNIKKMTQMMIKKLDKHEKMLVNVEQSGQTRQRYIISESGLYRLINNSKSSNAKGFKKWIISRILPKFFNTYSDISEPQSNKVSVKKMAKIITDDGIAIDQIKLFIWLREYGLCIKPYKCNVPTIYAENFGLMDKTTNIINNQSIETTLITKKGQIYILDRFRSMA